MGQLRQAETSYRQKQNRSAIEAAAREATQTAEESRVMAVKQKAEEEAQAQATAEKKAAEDRAAQARVDAEAEARGRAEAEAARTQAETARSQAEAAKAEAERSKLEAQQAAQEAARQKQEAEQAKAEAIAQQQALAVEADRARQAGGTIGYGSPAGGKRKAGVAGPSLAATQHRALHSRFSTRLDRKYVGRIV